MSYSKDYLAIKIILVAVFVFSALPSFSDEYPLEFPINQNILTRYAIVAIDEARIALSTATGLEKDAESPPNFWGSKGYASEIYDTSNPTIMAINYKNHSGKLTRYQWFPNYQPHADEDGHQTLGQHGVSYFKGEMNDPYMSRRGDSYDEVKGRRDKNTSTFDENLGGLYFVIPEEED